MFGIEKTTVRLIINLPAYTATVQRLYDYGAWFKLTEEQLRGAETITDFLLKLKAQGGKLIKQWDCMDDDDLQQHTMVLYEYTA